MNGTNLDAVKAKIEKLLRLSGSPNVHEAALAAARAQELLDLHDLAECQLNVGQDDRDPDETESCEESIFWATDSVQIPRWRSLLAHYIAKANGCYSLRHSRGGQGDPRAHVSLFGRRSRVERVRYLHELYSRMIDESARIYARGKARPRAAANGFRIGAAFGIGDTIIKQRDHTRAQQAPRTSALVALDRVFDRHRERSLEGKRHATGHYNVTRLGRSTISDGAAANAGRSAGASMANQAGGTRALGSGAHRLKG